MKYFDTFTGIGGFTIPMEELGWECVGYSEIDKYAIKIYSKHFPSHKNYGSITDLDVQSLPDHDILCGGFPCQSFSVAGKRGGFEDTRGTLFFSLAEIARIKRPKYLFFENVKGLLSHDEGNTFATILSTLDELGYDLQWQVLNSKYHGVPQNRERVFIIGHIRGEPRPKIFPFVDVEKIYEEEREPIEVQAQYCSDCGSKWLQEGQTDMYTEGIVRRLTPTECERLQGFPDGWTEGVSDTQRYKTLGNAVTVNVIRDIVRQF